MSGPLDLPAYVSISVEATLKVLPKIIYRISLRTSSTSRRNETRPFSRNGKLMWREP